MKFFLVVMLTALLGWVLHLMLPWWAIVVAGLIIGGVIQNKSATSFLATFLSGVILWGGIAVFINAGNDGVLAAKIGELFGNIGTSGILAVTALFGGILAGFGGLTGSLFRQLMRIKG